MALWCKLGQSGSSAKHEMEIPVLPPEAVSISLRQMALAGGIEAPNPP